MSFMFLIQTDIRFIRFPPPSALYFLFELDVTSCIWSISLKLSPNWLSHNNEPRQIAAVSVPLTVHWRFHTWQFGSDQTVMST